MFNPNNFSNSQILDKKTNIFGMNSMLPIRPMTQILSNNDWRCVYNINNTNLFTNSQIQEKKMNVIFKTSNGRNINLVIEIEKTIKELIIAFFKRINQEPNQSDICFIYNSSNLNFNDNTKLNYFFSMNPQPIIYANDVRNLIGAGEGDLL